MLRNIVKGYKELFASLAKIIFLILLCGACGAAAVFPLWKFAVSAPGAYTYTVLALILLAAIVLILKKIKKSGIKAVLFFLSKLLIILAGLFIIFILVTSGKRFLSIPVLIAMIFLYGLVNSSSKTQKKELENEDN